MSDLQLPDRLTQLRSRWEADPASRIFLQLAEEYRHLGRLHEALSVLEAGLKEHPGYLSALVAKGRCLLDLGNPEPAREVLERVVRQDATQAVANKLLVRAYVETGQGDRARERLDLYSLLHDGDPEIEELRGRIRRLESGGPGARPEPKQAPAAAPVRAAAAPAPARAPMADDEDPFSLPSPPKAAPAPSTVRAARAAVSAPAHEENMEDVFQLDYPPAPRRAAGAAGTEIFKLDFPVPAAAAPPTVPPSAGTERVSEAPAVALDEPEPTPEGEPFPGLVSRAVRERYLSGLAAEGLFPLSLDLAPPPPPPPAAAEPIHAPGEIFPLRSIGEAVEAELQREALKPELRREAPEPEPEPLPEPLLPPEPEPIALAPKTPELPQLPQLLETSDFVVADLAPAPEAPAAALPEVATVTLGELYRKQGHVGEAERIFEEVLRREPDNIAAKAARAALAQMPQASSPTAGREEPAVAAEPEPGGRKARKVRLLNSYLERIRRGSHPDVP